MGDVALRAWTLTLFPGAVTFWTGYLSLETGYFSPSTVAITFGKAKLSSWERPTSSFSPSH